MLNIILLCCVISVCIFQYDIFLKGCLPSLQLKDIFQEWVSQLVTFSSDINSSKNAYCITSRHILIRNFLQFINLMDDEGLLYNYFLVYPFLDL